jgi:hypothetical protein
LGFINPSVKSGRYQDHEGNLYQVVGSARNAVTLTEVVIYEALFRKPSSRYWVIPVNKFKEKIRVNGKNVPRFRKINPKS